MYRYRRALFAIAVFALLGVVLCASMAAQGPTDLSASNQPTTNSDPETPPATPANPEGSPWLFNIAPYAFFPGVNGTVGVRRHEASVHVSGSDLLNDFNGGLSGFMQAQKNRLVLPLDFIWTRIDTDKAIPLTDSGSVRAQMSQVIFTPKIGYRIVDTEHLRVDALVGVRVWHENPTLTVRPANNVYSSSLNWADGIAGGKFELAFNRKFWVTISGDAGGGGASLDYQTIGTINIQPKPMFGFFAGWRYLSVNYVNASNRSFFDLAQSGPIIGLNFQKGGKPPVAVAANCSASPTEVWAGEPVTANLTPANFNPKHELAYNWTSSGAKVSGTNSTANVDTAGLAPGSYTVAGTASDPKEKKNNTASCNTMFAVKQPHAPTVACSSSPDTVKPGDPATFTVTASNPDNFPLTYGWSSQAGNLTPDGSRATLDTANAPQGAPVTATATVTDSRGLTASCNASVNVLSPPVVVSEVSEIGECSFGDVKRPARVDNTCKALLDDIALRIQHEPNGKFVVVGFAEEEEQITVTKVGAQRAVNVKYYLVNGEGGSQIDATRLEVRTSGTLRRKGAKVYFVPAGATFSQESVVIDETQLQGQPRNAPARKRAKKAASAQITGTP
jgi:hypothetical protein